MSRQQIVKIILVFCLAPLSFCLWLFLRWGFWQIGHHWFLVWFGPLVCILFTGLILGLLIFLSEKPWWFLLAAAVIISCFLMLFGAFWYCWPAALISSFFIFFGATYSLHEKQELIKLRFLRILRPMLSGLMTGVVILAACAWYGSPIMAKSIKEISIPEPLFKVIFKPFKGIFFNQLTQKTLGLVNFLGADSVENILTQIPDEQLEKEMYQLTNDRFRAIIKLYQDYVSVGLALALLAGLRTLSIPFVFLMIFLTWLLIEIMIKLGFLKIVPVPVQKEVLRMENSIKKVLSIKY